MRRVTGCTHPLADGTVFKRRPFVFLGLFLVTTETKRCLLGAFLQEVFEVGGMGRVTARTMPFEDRFVGDPAKGDLRHLLRLFFLIFMAGEAQGRLILDQKEPTRP